jgi:hypothetical protein
MEGRLPAVEDSWEYNEYTAADKRQMLVLQLGGWAWGQQPLTVKKLVNEKS